ncbi:MAG: hypothetical protein WBZ36_02220 [Candidatus Nitrosopolaris sp.]
MKNMFHYAKGIRRLQRELKISISDLPQFGLVGPITTAEEENSHNDYWLDGSYTETQNEIENYELQDPYTIEREPDLTTEQEEYFRRIRQEWIDPGTYE